METVSPEVELQIAKNYLARIRSDNTTNADKRAACMSLLRHLGKVRETPTSSFDLDGALSNPFKAMVARTLHEYMKETPRWIH